MIPMSPLEVVGIVAVSYTLGYATHALIAYAKSRLP